LELPSNECNPGMKDIVLRLVMSFSPASADMYVYVCALSLSLSQRMIDRERDRKRFLLKRSKVRETKKTTTKYQKKP